MSREVWQYLKYFKKSEFSHPEEMDVGLLMSLDKMRAYAGKPFIIHCSYEQRNSSSYHCLGLAVDGHFVDMDLMDMFILATRFDFMGIGAYNSKVWNNPGLHLDKRPDKGMRSLWGCTMENSKREYVALNSDFFREALNI